MIDVLKVRVARSKVRNRIPFDLIYLIPKSKPELVTKLFSYALHFANLKQIASILYRIIIKDHDAVLSGQQRVECSVSGKDTIEHYYTNYIEAYTMLVPIRTKPHYKLGYLLATKHIAKPGRNSPFYTLLEQAELVTPKGLFKPICTLCPRQLFYLRGECTLGSQICLDTLTL